MSFGYRLREPPRRPRPASGPPAYFTEWFGLGYSGQLPAYHSLCFSLEGRAGIEPSLPGFADRYMKPLCYRPSKERHRRVSRKKYQRIILARPSGFEGSRVGGSPTTADAGRRLPSSGRGRFPGTQGPGLAAGRRSSWCVETKRAELSFRPEDPLNVAWSATSASPRSFPACAKADSRRPQSPGFRRRTCGHNRTRVRKGLSFATDATCVKTVNPFVSSCGPFRPTQMNLTHLPEV